jgi:hypothetical protein
MTSYKVAKPRIIERYHVADEIIQYLTFKCSF